MDDHALLICTSTEPHIIIIKDEWHYTISQA